jgi:transposase
MAKTYSLDLRKRVFDFVMAGHSCHEAAVHFSTSVSFVVNLMQLFRQTGSLKARPRGGLRHSKLAPHGAFLLAQVAETPDITMPELVILLKARGVTVAPSSVSHFLLRNGLSYKKNSAGKRNVAGGRVGGTRGMDNKAAATHG